MYLAQRTLYLRSVNVQLTECPKCTRWQKWLRQTVFQSKNVSTAFCHVPLAPPNANNSLLFYRRVYSGFSVTQRIPGSETIIFYICFKLFLYFVNYVFTNGIKIL